MKRLSCLLSSAVVLVSFSGSAVLGAETPQKTGSVKAGSRSLYDKKTTRIPAPPDLLFIDKQGKLAIPYALYEASDFHEGLAPVLIADQWGYIDRQGNVAIGAEYELAGDFREGLAPVKIKDKWGYIDKRGNTVIEPRFASAETFENGYAVVQLSKDSPEFPKRKNEQLQAILADPSLPPDKKAWLAINGSRVAGLIDKSGKFVFAPEYNSIRNFSEGLALAKDGLKTVFVNQEGRIVLTPSCQDARPFSEGLAAVQLKDKWGFIDKKGALCVKPIFDKVDDFHKGLAAASVRKKWGFIDKKGKWSLPAQFDAVWEGFDNDVAVVAEDMCPLENNQSEITRVGKGFLVAKRTGASKDFDISTTPIEPGYFAYPDFRFSIVDKGGKSVNEKQFEHLGSLSEGLRVVRVDGKFGYTDNTGNIFLAPRFKSAEPFSQGLALVQEGSTKSSAQERIETMLKQPVPVLVTDPELAETDVSVCTQVIKKDPSNALAFRDRGYLLCALGRFDEGLADFSEVTRLCSSSPEGYYWRGMVNMQLFKYAEAAVDFTSAIELDNTKPQSYLGRALALQALKRNEMALKDINSAIALQDQPYYRKIRGQILATLDHFREALADLQAGRNADVITDWPAGPDLQADLIEQIALADKFLNEARKPPVDDEKLALSLAQKADALEELRLLKSREHKVLELEDICKQAVELRRDALRQSQLSTTDGTSSEVYRSDLSSALAHLAAFYVRARRFEEALSLYGEAMALQNTADKQNILAADLNLELGKLYFEKREFEKAWKYIKKTLVLTRDSSQAPARILAGQALSFKALVLMHMNDSAAGLVALKQAAAADRSPDESPELACLPRPPALAQNASSADAYELALTCKSLGLIESSRGLAQEAIERATTRQEQARAQRFIKAYLPKKSVDLKLTKKFLKAKTCERTGDLLRAEELYEECLETAPGFEWAYEALARLARLQNERENAEKHARKATSLNPCYIDGWLELARIKIASGRISQAREIIDKVLKLDPDCQEAKLDSLALARH